MLSASTIALVALSFGLWIAAWAKLAKIPMRRLQWRGPASVILGVNAVCLFALLGSSVSTTASHLLALAAYAVLLALPACLAWPMVARRRR